MEFRLNGATMELTHKEVPDTKVLQHISQILNDHGFFPTGGVIRIGNLPLTNGGQCPMVRRLSKLRQLQKRLMQIKSLSEIDYADVGSVNAHGIVTFHIGDQC